jgi:S-adenosylmethionine:tRNA ribosyltransferase-isomerase
MKARMYGELTRSTGTSRQIELLFANRLNDTTWEVLCKPGKRIRAGDRVTFAEGAASGVFGEVQDYGLRLLAIESGIAVGELFERFGHLPLPPYIDREDTPSDLTEYQTMFAQQAGAVAAPTAGLHFTPEVLAELAGRKIQIVRITLHVGVGTFLPVRVNDPREHRLKPEMFSVSEESAQCLQTARRASRRIIAVGTTSIRALEYVIQHHGEFVATTGYTDMYILPGYRFRAIDGLLTNFHLPRSTLLMLVSAFVSRDRILEAYQHAIQAHYRFYSYGDCMLII